MKFQIEKLIIWPKKTSLSPQEIDFHIGQVNVITGASRTGKSAIIPIIDYCLASGSCAIPIEVVRDNASWYGVIIYTESEKILLARRAPEGTSVSQECFVLRGSILAVPPRIESKNQNVAGVKELLDSLAKVPYLNRDENDGAYNERLSFRDLTHLVFQSQDIVANQNILFYKTHEVAHREKLKNWLPFILGAETIEIIQARHELKELERILARHKKEFDKAKALSNEWLQNLFGQINVAKEYGLYTADISQPNDIDTLLIIAKEILKSDPDVSKADKTTLSEAQKAIKALEADEAELSEKIAITQKRQRDIEKLERSLSGFQNSAKRKVDRLAISDWIKSNTQPAAVCPVCGASEHPAAHGEIEKICSVLSEYEKISVNSLPLPAAFEREKTDLDNELQALLDQKNNLQKRFDFLRSKDEEARKYHQRTRDMFLFLGQLKSTVELVDHLTETGGVEDKIRNLEERKKLLDNIISSSNVKNRLDRTLQEISILTLNRLKTLDVGNSYKEVPPTFSLTELAIQVSGKDGILHFLSEVGSASNWVSFHLAFTSALQEFFIKQTQPPSCVPSFVIYDQPSQVYFPRISNTAASTDDDPSYEDEDVESVKKMFSTIAASIKTTGGKWQAIVLDHARSDIYGGMNGIVEIAEWRNGKKLIPEHWYQSENKVSNND
jgi:hypothetical protein